MLLAVFSILVFNTAKAQNQSFQHRCATDELMQQLFQKDPVARARYQNTQRQLETRIKTVLENRLNRIQSIINIPVVVHIATANPALITDAIVQNQIDSLNFFYGSQPTGDSLRTYTPFRNTYGRSDIRFCLAKRTPNNTATTGIERIVNSTTFQVSGPLVHPSTQIPSWDPTKYLNIWVVKLEDGYLGYSFLPGSFSPNDPQNGYVSDYRCFGAGPDISSGGYHYDNYNLGRTAIHEIGHFFNLLHPWGSLPDSNPGCANDDGCGDTPLTGAPTFGCPSAPVTNACSPIDPGVMFQNHMDYADDACMLLFTVNQCARLNASLTSLDRVGLTTSNGCQPFVINDDAQISAILNPANGSSIACTSIPLSVTLRNNGTNLIASAVINVSVDGALSTTQNFAGSLAAGATININLANLNIAALGSHIIKVYSTLPNGNADSNPSNDTTTITISRGNAATLPVLENFEGTFPSAGWQNKNPDAAVGWAKVASLSPGGSSSARVDFYNYDILDRKDSLITPDIDMTNPPGLKSVSFDRAYASYRYPPVDEPFGSIADTLEILVSTDCGATYTTVWKKYAALTSDPNSLNTSTINTTSQYAPGNLSEWLDESIDITAVVGASPLARIMFKTINRFGNDLYVDNINIGGMYTRDMGVSAISNPLFSECSNTVTPQVTVKNFGTEVVNTYSVQYTIDGANPLQVDIATPLASGATIVVTLPASAVLSAGTHVFLATTLNPTGLSGTGEQNSLNDASSRNFTVRNITTVPAIETFEGALFPSPNWSIANPNNNNTWIRRTDAGYLSYKSAFIDNYNSNTPTQVDDILTPVFRTTGTGGAQADSVIITWDLAAHYWPATPYDTFTVRTSPDCGNTFPNVLFNNGGAPLGLADGNDFVAPLESDWKSHRVAVGGAALASGTHMVGFRNKNQFGNNMFVDNINVSLLFKRDIQVAAINRPAAECVSTFAPNVSVKNNGTETVTAFSVSYRINNGAIQTANFTGQNLARNAQINVSLPANAGALADGSHTITVFTFNPVTASGTGDQWEANDTLTRSFSIIGSLPAPFVETFTGPTFPPANWGIVNPNGDITWSRNTVGNNNTGSAYINNWSYLGRGQIDYLNSPNITYTGIDSISLSFDIAAVTKVYPGSQQIPLDTVQVLITTNCGNTFTSVYKKWGNELQTVGNPNDPTPFEFLPLGPSHWRTEKIDLTAFAPNGPIQIVFKNTNGFGNNVFIDNVNVNTRTLPSSLKLDGLQISPNPFQSTFQIWHLQTPTNLRYVNVYNSAGQRVWSKQYNANAQKIIDVDMSRNAAGVYTVELGYDDKNKNLQIRIVKSGQ